MAATAKIAIIVTATTAAAAKKLKGLGGTMGTLGKIGAALGGAAVVGVGALAVGIGKLAMDAAMLEPTRVTFDNLTASIGSTADSMLDKLRPATMGVVADSDLMRAANKLMAMGLADTEEQAAKLSEMAVKLGTAMGEDATASMENFALMLANQSIPRLDSFGISSGRVRERILELMEADEDLTREQAFLTATMEAGEAAMEKVGDVSGTTGVAMQQVRATFTNVKDQIGQAFIPILAKLLIPLGDLATKYGPQVTAWAEKLAGWIEIKLVPAFGTLIKFGSNLVSFIKDNWIAILAGLATLLVTVVIPAFIAWATTASAAAIATIAAIAPVAAPILAVIAVVALLKKAWESNFLGIRDITAKVAGAIRGILDKLIEGVKKIIGGIVSLLNKIPGVNIGIKVPGRQYGGPVSAGRPYMVGERGPELFIPGRSGRVAAGAGAGGGGSITINIGSVHGTDRVAAQNVSRMIAEELRRANIKYIRA